MGETVTIRLVLDTGFIGGEHEKEIHVPREDWETWDADSREQYVRDELSDFMNDQIGTSWEVVDED